MPGAFPVRKHSRLQCVKMGQTLEIQSFCLTSTFGGGRRVKGRIRGF